MFPKGVATFTNGSTTVSNISMSIGDIASVARGTRLDLGGIDAPNNILEAIDRSISDNTIELREAFTGATAVYSFKITYTGDGFREAAQAMRDTRETLLDLYVNSDTNPTPDALALRDNEGNIKVGDAVEDNDAVNLRLANQLVRSYANTSSLENSRPTQTGQRAENRERANAQYVLAASGYTAKPGDIVAANGRVWELQKNAGVWNAKHFGAKGDDAGDDTFALNGALGRLSQYESLHIPAGTYRVSSSLIHSTLRTSVFGDGNSTRIKRTGDGFDIVAITPTDTLNGSVGQITFGNMELSGEGISNNTGGNGLRLTQVLRGFFNNLHINGNYGGILIQGCNSLHFTDVELYSDQNFGGALKAGSYLVKLEKLQRATGFQVPSGMFFDSLQARGSIGNGHLDNGFVIEAADNIWVNNAHIGLLSGAAVLIAPQDANDSTFGVNFKAAHFDGMASSGPIMENCVKYDIGPSVPASKIRGHSYVGCQFSTATGDGFTCNAVGNGIVTDVVITDGRVNAIQGWGFNINDGSRFVISDMTFYDMTSSTGGITIKDLDFSKFGGVISGAPIGMQITGNATRADVDIVFQDCGVDIDNSGTNISNRFEGLTNQTNSVASASEISLPLPQRFFTITGTTTINTISANSAMVGREVTLTFSGSCAVTDGDIRLAGAFTSTAGSTLTLIYNGNVWAEKSRAIV